MTGWRGTPRPRFTRIKVADASAMPYGTNGDIYAPVIMLAEKAADLIPGRTPLDPIRAPFYRHELVLTG